VERGGAEVFHTYFVGRKKKKIRRAIVDYCYYYYYSSLLLTRRDETRQRSQLRERARERFRAHRSGAGERERKGSVGGTKGGATSPKPNQS
jgi:hypothetical protein